VELCTELFYIILTLFLCFLVICYPISCYIFSVFIYVLIGTETCWLRLHNGNMFGVATPSKPRNMGCQSMLWSPDLAGTNE